MIEPQWGYNQPYDISLCLKVRDSPVHGMGSMGFSNIGFGGIQRSASSKAVMPS
jgi:hypothetical protein